jgi:membrane protease YdiL (CAAX protease family)
LIVEELTPAMPLLQATSAATAGVGVIPRRKTVLPTWLAVIEVGLVCGFPTLLLIYTVLILGTNLPVLDGDFFSLEFLALSGLLDTALVALLIRVFLMLSGETSRDVFVGIRPLKREILRGLIAVPLMVAGVSGLMTLLRVVAPWTHTVAQNPYDRYMHNPIDVTILLMTVVLAGGVREELQRGFILHRFEQRLGGMWVGLALYTVVFGAMHASQGMDAAITVGLLGLCWGLFYVRRRSSVTGMVSHAGFDAAQVLLTFFGR